MRRTLVVAFLATVPFFSHAACVCRCVNGDVQPICTSATDLPPICSPRVCPITPPSIAPIGPVVVPPVGTSSCRNEQVLNPITGRYEWKLVCR